MCSRDRLPRVNVRIDSPLLGHQRQWPLELTERTAHDQHDLKGLISLLDEVAHQAHDQCGIANTLTGRTTALHDRWQPRLLEESLVPLITWIAVEAGLRGKWPPLVIRA